MTGPLYPDRGRKLGPLYPERDRVITQRVLGGETLRAVAEAYGLSTERVLYIVHRWCAWSHPGWYAIAVRTAKQPRPSLALLRERRAVFVEDVA